MNSYGVPSEGEQELTVVTDAALGLLMQSPEVDRSIVDAPPSVLRVEILDAARQNGISDEDAEMLARAATSEIDATGLAEVLIAGLRHTEAIREELDLAAARRGELMVIDPISVGAAALLLAVLKVRRVKVSKKDGVDISFDAARPGILSGVLAFIKGSP